MLVYSLANLAAAPRLITVGGVLNDFVVVNGRAFIAANDLVTVDLTNPSSVPFTAPDASNTEVAIAVAGNWAFTATPHANDGRVRVYDITNPAAPVWLRDNPLQGGMTYRKLLPYGTDYLVALSTDAPAGRERDVVIINRANVNAMTYVADLPIASFTPVDAVIDGTTLYVSGGDAGVAIVDLTNPAAPQLVKLFDTPGFARGLAISGPNELAVADASGEGVTFVDVTNKQAPVIKGSQLVPGNPADVKVVGKSVYVAADQVVDVVVRP
jgi:hypothetical protein